MDGIGLQKKAITQGFSIGCIAYTEYRIKLQTQLYIGKLVSLNFDAQS